MCRKYILSAKQHGEFMSEKTALVVDDSFTMRDMVSITLQDANFNVTTAVDGVDALNTANSNKYDIVITDINMPNMDGIELIKRLRALPAFSKTPILVLTTEGGVEKKMQGKEAGATGWIVKPFDPETLIAAVSKVCA
jgi:two-component system, chemotaxis family, chemotaxis protein CheY